jgi:hypothetical protein
VFNNIVGNCTYIAFLRSIDSAYEEKVNMVVSGVYECISNMESVFDYAWARGIGIMGRLFWYIKIFYWQIALTNH